MQGGGALGHVAVAPHLCTCVGQGCAHGSGCGVVWWGWVMLWALAAWERSEVENRCCCWVCGVAVERPGFMRNPTSCAAFAVNSTITSTTSTTSTASTPFAVAGCSALPFKPAFTAQVSPHASKLDGAALTIKLASSETQANIAKVKVALPKQLPSRLETLQKACLAAVFATNPAACPPRIARRVRDRAHPAAR
jgi:hypothetical protein